MLASLASSVSSAETAAEVEVEVELRRVKEAVADLVRHRPADAADAADTRNACLQWFSNRADAISVGVLACEDRLQIRSSHLQHDGGGEDDSN